MSENLLSSLSSYSKTGLVIVSTTFLNNFSLSNGQTREVASLHLPYPGAWYVCASGWNVTDNNTSYRLDTGYISLSCTKATMLGNTIAQSGLPRYNFHIGGILLIPEEADVILSLSSLAGDDYTSFKASANFSFRGVCIGNYQDYIKASS